MEDRDRELLAHQVLADLLVAVRRSAATAQLLDALELLVAADGAGRGRAHG